MFNFLKPKANAKSKLNFLNWEIQRMNRYIKNAKQNMTNAAGRGNIKARNHYMRSLANLMRQRNYHKKERENLLRK